MKIEPIRSEEAYKSALERAAVLISKSDQKSVDELEVLQALIERWERGRYEISAPTPVEAIRFRMHHDGLRPRDLEPYIGSRSRVSEVLSGTRPLSIDMIRAFHRHLGIPAASLIGGPLDSSLSKAAQPSKAALDKLRTFGLMEAKESVSEFIRRAFGSTDALAMLRKTRTERTNAKTDIGALDAWCAAVMLKANHVTVPRSKKSAPRMDAGRELARLSTQPNGAVLVREVLGRMGIVFVVLDHLPGTYLDGAAMCRQDGTPVIAMTLRHDRVDNFWFTLLHELCHVTRHLKEGTTIILDDLELKSSDDVEGEADAFAQEALIPPALWKRASSPDLTAEEVVRIAAEAQVHPAIVAGRWQRDHGDYRRFSKMLGRGEVRALLRNG